jgi:hypothetical protein
MKTKDFIKLLQEADPEGEAHVRMYGGVPTFADSKPGYWDGPYHYIDEEGNWVYSSKGSKVDIWCTEIDDFVSEMIDTYNTPSWEDVQKKFKFELTYSDPGQRKEREDSILKSAKEAYDSSVDMHRKFREEGEERALKNAADGWTWFQNKLVDDETIKPNMHHYYTWKVYAKPEFFGLVKKEESSNPYNVQAVMKSGLFERLDNNKMPGYYEWVLKK